MNIDERVIEEFEFEDDSVKEIALTFEIPRNTALSWKSNLGEVDIIKQTLGENTSGNYLDLIRRREWIPFERKKIENEWFEPAKPWCGEKADEVYTVHRSKLGEFLEENEDTGYRSLGLGSEWVAIELLSQVSEIGKNDDTVRVNWSDEMLELQDELQFKEEQVKYEMKRIDSEWIGLTRELRQAEKELVEIYRTHLQDSEKELEYKKDRIIELKQSFPYLRANNDLLVAETTDSSIYYVDQFKYTAAEEVVNHKTPKHLASKVRNRDNNQCVRCGAENSLIVHHIISRGEGGKNEMDNLATLCEYCHDLAHESDESDGWGDSDEVEGISSSVVSYDTVEEFWESWVLGES